MCTGKVGTVPLFALRCYTTTALLFQSNVVLYSLMWPTVLLYSARTVVLWLPPPNFFPSLSLFPVSTPRPLPVYGTCQVCTPGACARAAAHFGAWAS